MSSLWSLDVDGLIVFERWVVFLGFLSGILGWFLGLLLIDLPRLDRVCWLLFGRHVLSSVQLEHYNFLYSSSWFRTSILAKFIWNQIQLLRYLVKVLVNHVQLFVIPWTVACEAPLSIEFSRWKYWSGSLSLLQGNVLTQRSNLGSPTLQAYSLPSESPGETQFGPKFSSLVT